MKTPEGVWNDITEILDPVTVAEGEIESVRLTVCNGGVNAKTAEPIPTPDYDSDVGEFDPEEDDPQEHIEKLQERTKDITEEDLPENEEIKLYNDFGVYLKNLIFDRLEEAVISTPPRSSCSVVRCTVTEDSISPVVTLKNRVNGESWVKDDLATALDESGRIESEEKLAYGTVDSVYYDDGYHLSDDEGWRFDGTLYKYTDEPFDYWSEGHDSDYPTNMEEWAEFASDTEGRKEHILNKETHAVHFHPMERGLSDDNPLIEWFMDVQDDALSRYVFDESLVESKNLNVVTVDDTGYRTTLHLIL